LFFSLGPGCSYIHVLGTRHASNRCDHQADIKHAMQSAGLLPRHKPIPGNEAAFGRFGPLPFDVLVLGAINV
jgi:hypothetical protein